MHSSGFSEAHASGADLRDSDAAFAKFRVFHDILPAGTGPAFKKTWFAAAGTGYRGPTLSAALLFRRG